MKLRNEYIAPQITVLGLRTGEILTDLFDSDDTWRPDPFEAVESVLRR